jgi:hypothetical protein
MALHHWSRDRCRGETKQFRFVSMSLLVTKWILLSIFAVRQFILLMVYTVVSTLHCHGNIYTNMKNEYDSAFYKSFEDIQLCLAFG